VGGFRGVRFLTGLVGGLGLFGFGEQYTLAEEVLQINFLH
jgi:hypothetical protein